MNERFLWRNFEEDLFHFGNENFFDNYNQIDVLDDSFKPSECHGLEDEKRQEADYLIKILRVQFRNCISEVDFDPRSMKTMKAIDFAEAAILINFNYTATLIHLYGICRANIFYVHNAADEYEELIFGHGETIEDNPLPDELDFDGKPTGLFLRIPKEPQEHRFLHFKKTRVQ